MRIEHLGKLSHESCRIYEAKTQDCWVQEGCLQKLHTFGVVFQCIVQIMFAFETMKVSCISSNESKLHCTYCIQ